MYSKDSRRVEEQVEVEMLTHACAFILQRQEGKAAETASTNADSEEEGRLAG